MSRTPTKLSHLTGASFVVPPTEHTAKISEFLNANPELPGVIVTEGEDLRGMASREAIAHCLSRRFGRELYLQKPVSEMLSEVPEPMVIDDSETIQRAVRRGLGREPHARYEPIVSKRGDGFRLISFHSLLLAQSKLLFSARETITRQKEAAEAASEAKTQFLANMSHEIRTPLTAILGFTENLRDPNISESERAESIETVLRQGEHLLEVINGILDLSKIEAGRLEIEPLWHSPIDLAHEVINFLDARATAKGLNLSLVLDHPVPDRVFSDPTRLRQILINLLGNSIKFTDRGEVRLHLSFENDDGSKLLFHVVDTGIGLSDEQIERLFKPFVQADNSMARRYGGTGLGLSICLHLADMLGGSIRVQSALGVGSRFTVAVDAGITHEHDVTFVSELHHRRTTIATGHETFERRLAGRVLLAEDSPDNQLLLTRFLTRAGATVEVADNGLIAVERIRQSLDGDRGYQVILMDMQMPRMDGYEATRALRSQGVDLPIIALTANAMDGEEQRCLDAGCTGYTTKPIDRPALIAILEQYLSPTQGRAIEVCATTLHTEGSAQAAVGMTNGSFNLDAALERLGGDRELLYEVMELVVQEIPNRIEEANEGLASQDMPLLRRAVHSLKNSAENVGAKPASAQALEVEKTLRIGESPPDELAAMVTATAARFETLSKDLQAFLARTAEKTPAAQGSLTTEKED